MLSAVVTLLTVPAAAHADPLTDVNALRAHYRLPPVVATTEPAAAAVTTAIAARAAEQTPTVTAGECGCYVNSGQPWPTDSSYDPDDSAYAYRQAGGRQLAGFWMVPDGGSLREPGALALLADPRVRELAIARGGAWTVLGAFAEPNARLTVPLVLTPRVDLGARTAPLLLASAAANPDKDPELAFTRRSGKRWLPAGTISATVSGDGNDATGWPGLGGAVLVSLAPEPGESAARLAYGQTYRVSTEGSAAATFTTAPVPALVRKRSFTFDRSVTPALRRIFLRNVRGGNPTLRKYLERVDGFITVRTHSGATPSFAGYDFVSLHRGHLADRKLSAHLTWHELGHVLDNAALDDRADQLIERAMHRSRSWRCFPYQAGCVGFAEAFADQVGFLATGNRRVRSGYGVPPLLSAGTLKKLLRDELAFAPSRYGWEPADG